MKKFTIILLVILAMLFNTNAQIPNSGFENWTTIGSYENPDGWATMNPYCAGPFYSSTKSTDHYPANVGSYSIRLENNTSLTQYTGGWGISITDTMAYPIQPSFRIVGHPDSLCGYYKYFPLNSDSLFIRILVFQSGIVVGGGMIKIGVTVATWTPFIIPFTYSSADSATIMLLAFSPTGPTDGPNGNSVLYIDNLSFDSLVGSVPLRTLKNTMFNLFPNPASDIVTLNIDNTEKSDIILNIYNVVGELISSEKLQENQQKINTGNLNNGVYIVEIKSEGWAEKQKLIIQR
ncbi:MAG: T9SS type A sorting domain-containing protein [Bacteroidales bacterium]|nr:T9SS type A sorting domain-containing protein [Bacteroidales bacterium]